MTQQYAELIDSYNGPENATWYEFWSLNNKQRFRILRLGGIELSLGNLFLVSGELDKFELIPVFLADVPLKLRSEIKIQNSIEQLPKTIVKKMFGRVRREVPASNQASKGGHYERVSVDSHSDNQNIADVLYAVR